MKQKNMITNNLYIYVHKQVNFTQG